MIFQPPAFGVAPGLPLADPTAALLDDGRIRLYLFAQDVGVVGAVSTDGLDFTEEPGVRVSGPDGGQPRIWRLPDGRWRLYVTKIQEIVSYTSADGLTFTLDPGIRVTAQATGLSSLSSPAILEYAPGRYRMYYSTLAQPRQGPGDKQSGSATSSDLLNWIPDPGIRLGPGAAHLTGPAEHPFPVLLEDGHTALFFGRFQALGSSPGGSPDGLYRAVSSDGLTFTEEVYTGIYFANDPEVLRLADGSEILFYGDFDTQVGGMILSASCDW